MINPPAVIFDIDGTLADCSHRRHFIANSPKDWKGFFNAMKDDKPLPMAIAFQRHLKRCGYEMLFITGRPNDYRTDTVDWLIRHDMLPPPSHLFMRCPRDFRPDYEFKAQIYRERIEPWWRVQLVIDDRASVVKMWRGLGLECWQVAEGEF